jgi:hypothetical protein
MENTASSMRDNTLPHSAAGPTEGRAEAPNTAHQQPADRARNQHHGKASSRPHTGPQAQPAGTNNSADLNPAEGACRLAPTRRLLG